MPRLRVRTPRGAAWGVSMIAGAWVLLLAATAGLGFGIGAGSAKRYVFDMLLVIGPVLMGVGIVRAVRARRHLRALAHSRDEKLCPQCFYDLRGVLAGTSVEARCPECGLRVRADAVARAWAEYR